jgi:hypothetical protein
MAGIPVDSTAFAVFEMQALTADTFDAGIQSVGDDLAVVFFWGLDCFNCEIAKKAMLACRTRSARSGCAGFTAMCTSIASWASASCCMACRRGSSFTGASVSGGRRAGMGWRNSKRPSPRRVRKSARLR